MAIRAEPKPDQVELGWLVAAYPEREAQVRLVGQSRGVEIGRLALHAVDRLRPEVGQLRDEHPVGRPEVRLRIVRRHRALVPPEELDPAPVHATHPWLIAQEWVDGVGRGSTRERDAKDAARLDRRAGALHEPVGSLGRHRGQVREHHEARLAECHPRRGAHPPSSWTALTSAFRELSGSPLRAAARKMTAARSADS